MDLNRDCLEIVKYLLDSDDYIHVKELSDIYKVTERAIRYKLDRIDKFFILKGFNPLERKYKAGIKINKDKALISYIEKFFRSYTPFQYVFSKEERKCFMRSELLQSDEPINISYFMSVLNVSKNTVIKELNEIELFFKENNLKLVRRPKVGLFIEGKEKHKRLALSKVNSEMISVEDLFNYISRGKGNSKTNTLQFETLFSDIDLDYLDMMIKEIEESLGIKLSDSAYGSLITHLVIMIKRIQLDKHILLIDAPIDSNLYKDEIKIAESLVKKIEKHFNIFVPSEEINYIVLHILGSKLLKANSEEVSSEEYSLRNVIRKIIKAMEAIYNIEFKNERTHLMEGLLLHLRPALNRLRFNLSIENPLYDEITIQYRELFENTKRACAFLEEYIGKPINNHEISYIMLHFGAAIRNEVEKTKPFRVILVCGSGIGAANMLKSQLKEKYHIDIVDTISVRAVKDYDNSLYDLIISTINIPNIDEDKCVKINPLLMKNDYGKLDKKLFRKKMIKSSNHQVNIEKVMDTISKYADINDMEQLQLEILMILSEKLENRNTGFEKSLKDFLNPCSIQLSVPVRNWEDAVDKNCKILEENGSVLKSYGEAIKNKLRTIGPYMVIAPGIALLHTEINDGALDTDFSLMTLRQGVRFGKKDYDPVRLIITFSSKDGKSHLGALKDLTAILADKEKVLNIINADNKKEILQLL